MESFKRKYLESGVRVYSHEGSRLVKPGDTIIAKRNISFADGDGIAAGTHVRIVDIVLEPKEERGVKVRFQVEGCDHQVDKRDFR